MGRGISAIPVLVCFVRRADTLVRLSGVLLSDFEDVAQLDAELKCYIDYYNRYRIKSKLGGISPVEYSLQAAYRWTLTVQLLSVNPHPERLSYVVRMHCLMTTQ